MATSYAEFKLEHRSEHNLAFNRWSATVGNALGFLVGLPLILLGRWRAGAALFAVGGAALAIGHAVEGTLPQAVRDLIRHPVWATRADVELGLEHLRETVLPEVRPPR